MPLQLRVLATGQMVEVPNEGQTIGREGGQADIQIKDVTLSGRHARIFADGNDWLIQDLGSTNGTYLGEERVGTATEIHPNDIITMSSTKLEVIKVWNPQLQHTVLMAAPAFETAPTGSPAVARTRSTASAVVVAAEEPEEPGPTAPTMIGYAATAISVPAAGRAPVLKVSAAAAQGEVEPSAAGARTMIGYGAPTAARTGPSLAVARTPKREEVEEPPADNSPGETEAPEAVGADNGLKYFLVAVPKAIAFYLAAIPLMIVNPLGAIRKGVEEQKHEAKGKMELIAYALPVNLFSAAVGFISTLVVQLVTHTLSIGGLIVGLLVIPAIVAVVVSAITGYLWHPVTGWVITKLKGESDERSRTNYFLMFMTATTLVALPSGLGIILGLVPFRLVAMVQPALSALGSVVLIFVTYSWMTKFNVVKLFRTFLLVLGGLAIVGGAFGVLGRLTTAPGGTRIASGSDVEAQIEAVKKQGEEATTEAGAAQGTGEAKAPVQKVENEAGVKEPAVAAAEKPAAAAADPSVPYPTYVKMRDAVEKAIADDPALLNRSPELLALYHGYTNTTFEVDTRFKALNEKNPADAKLNVRLREAELFAKTEKAVGALYARLKPSGQARAEAPAEKEEKPKAEAKPAPAPAPAAKEEKPKAPAGKGKLACSSKPAAAQIWVDGKNTGKTTPLPVSSALELPAGKHTVIFKLNGKASAPVEITIEPDRPVVLKGVEIPGA